MNCRKDKPCVTHHVWNDLNKLISDYMKNITIGDVVNQNIVHSLHDAREDSTNVNNSKINSSLSIPIYLDYSSTTPVDKRVASKMAECLTLDGAFDDMDLTHLDGIVII